MIKAVRHFGIVVSDLNRSLAFYRDLLGLKVIKSAYEAGDYIDNMLSLKNAQVTTVKLGIENESVLIELLKFESHTGTPYVGKIYDHGPTHFAFTVDDLNALYHKLVEAGVHCTATPQNPPNTDVLVTFCKDPDGVAIELVQA